MILNFQMLKFLLKKISSLKEKIIERKASGMNEIEILS